ncbi:MAG TPA: 50S ribosomal protein L18 [Longimicrobiales bacterium]|nr:50S ribosomal protein L18 [Longimicrobiales bacterium]
MANRRKTSRRESQRLRRHRRVRRKVVGTAERPRLVVHRSLKHIQGQLVDDVSGKVLLGLSSKAPEFAELRSNGDTDKTALSREVGKGIAAKAVEAGVEAVVFDRGGYLYHGRVAAFAEGAREGGLKF